MIMMPDVQSSTARTDGKDNYFVNSNVCFHSNIFCNENNDDGDDDDDDVIILTYTFLGIHHKLQLWFGDPDNDSATTMIIVMMMGGAALFFNKDLQPSATSV